MNAGNPRATSFGTQVRLYNESRPSYPLAAVRWLLSEVRSPDATANGSALKIVDLGAGTGKLTGVIANLGHEVWAVEPDPDMSALIGSNAPTATVLRGKDTNIPLPDESVDAVLVGQAWHWFDHARAEVEIARVLRPGGVLGILWNTYDWATAWVKEYDALLHNGDPRDASHSLPTVSWSDVEEHTASWQWQRTPAQLVELAGSVSWIMSLPTASKEPLLAQIRQLAQAQVGPDGTVGLAYVTQAYRFTKR